MAGGINPFGFAVSAPQPAPRAPIDLPSAPFGFAPPPSKWEQTAAILNEYNPIDAFWRLYNSDMAKGGAITDQNIEDGMMVGGTVMGGGAMIPKPANALNMGIRAYHGSPHSFDKFSMDKIGTGVGAPDAFSRGLYFSAAEKNAEHFKALGASPMIGGKKGRAAGLSDDAYESVWKFAHDEGKSGTLADVAAFAEADLLARSKELPFSARRQYQRVIDELKARGDEDIRLGANMYEVDINADPSSFADWDLPISQQSETVQKALSNFPPEKTWGEVYDTGAVKSGDMLNRGVSGTTFKANDGTRNYVVYDDNLISIVRKYGIAGASAMLGYNLLESVNPAQADELKRIEAGK